MPARSKAIAIKKPKQHSAKDVAASVLTVRDLNLVVKEFHIRGTAPFVPRMMKFWYHPPVPETWVGSKEPELLSDSEQYKRAKLTAKGRWHGIETRCFRSALIMACRIAGFHVTRAKISLFVVAAGVDTFDDSPIVKITKGKPQMEKLQIRRVAKGPVVDEVIVAKWNKGWEAKVRIQFDADQFTLKEVTDLMKQAGKQVGVGTGCPNIKLDKGQIESIQKPKGCRGLFRVL